MRRDASTTGAAIMTMASFLGPRMLPAHRESAQNRDLLGWGAYLPPPFPSHGRAGKTDRQAASAARSPDCAVALVVLAHAYLHGKCRGRVHENDDIEISKRLTKMHCDKRRRAEIWPSDCHPSNPHRDFERRLYSEVFIFILRIIIFLWHMRNEHFCTGTWLFLSLGILFIIKIVIIQY